MTIADKRSFPEIKGKVMFDEPLAGHTSFRIGGPADILAAPDDISELKAVLSWADKNSAGVFVMGAGTNLLASDRGFRGLVIKLQAGFSKMRVQGTTLTAGAAVRLPALVRKALGQGLAGLEGLAGIPGTVGGAVCMNAGTPQGCIGDALRYVTAVDFKGNEQRLDAEKLGLKYRKSDVDAGTMIIVEAVFDLRAEERKNIEKIVNNLQMKRKQSQPLSTWNAGSVFKNPPGGFAGEILEKLGAKGMQIGGARVSGKHANFIENTGNASAEDVRELMLKLQRLALEKANTKLEFEIQLIGEW